ncbi:M20/M25/M40 family metallo-hydrolase [Paenibacillus xylanilyticus]|uniref:M20/M25/M40 family metallo-hydrolase n=1 Tax=Paenibacillus xylanilyticus TaxID=248903 RepID=A0A7Y6BT71_9BACL|nr:M20/M25/M40 family metallo-hydrolase [Paenibacillus xylanilyticus]NUU74562.1 M20/M25/M40 family metallo-hydrolase [Paenibacillus xylanilyticus]
MKKWSTPQQIAALLSDLIRIPSISESEAEAEFPLFITQQLSELDYYRQHPEYLQSHPTGDGRTLVTALVKSQIPTARTIIVLSHFDVVEVDCYGDWKPYAFNVEKLTELFHSNKERLPEKVRADIETDDWIFGRGVMDMKCGLALQMSMIERACHGEFDGNLLLLAVPDEEVNSVGMRASIPVLLELAKRHGLEYALLINSESHFGDGDESGRYLEKGSIGKALPGFLCYGKETHVVYPFKGLNGNYMAAEITAELEMDTTFCEHVEGQSTPPPTNLIQHSMMNAYSVTIPYRAVTMSNLLLLEKSVDQLIEPLLDVARRAAARIEQKYHARASAYLGDSSEETNIQVKVMTYEELLRYAHQTYGEEQVTAVIQEALHRNPEADDRGNTSAVVDALSLLCKALSPMIVLFFAPPYYPPNSSYQSQIVTEICNSLSEYALAHHQFELHHANFHSAMTDLSYVGSTSGTISHDRLADNMPLWNKGYSIPLNEMEQLAIPVMNLGPYGKDAHKWTERLNVHYAFVTMPDLLSTCITMALAAGASTQAV